MFVTFVLIFKFILIYLLHVLFVLKLRYFWKEKFNLKVLKEVVFFIYTSYVPICKPPLLFSHFLRKIVNVINVSIFCVNITKLFFVYMCIKFDFSYFKEVGSIN